jgi:hypothetical protein
VGTENLAVRVLPLIIVVARKLVQKLMLPSSFRSWVLILGMSGLIVLVWFVGGGAALRYLVSIGLTNLSLHVLNIFPPRSSMVETWLPSKTPPSSRRTTTSSPQFSLAVPCL